MGVRRFVPMEALWSMPVEVPVSLLLQDDDLAWSCGQLALDDTGAVLHADDLAAQSAAVCDFIKLIGDRADLAPSALQRVLLYHAASTDDDVANMVGIFRQRFGPRVLLDPMAVPHFYYPGVLLECDAFFDAGVVEVHDSPSVKIRAGAELSWVTVDATDGVPAALDVLAAALEAEGLGGAVCLSEHWYAPPASVGDVHRALVEAGRGSADGHVVEVADESTVRGVLVLSRAEATIDETTVADDVVLTVRRAGSMSWLHARSVDGSRDLVGQTEQVMARIAGVLPSLGLTFADSAKCTAHYVGDDSPETLHGNMAVRNRHYAGSGLASTGLPVAGFADARSLISVDIMFRQ